MRTWYGRDAHVGIVSLQSASFWDGGLLLWLLVKNVSQAGIVLLLGDFSQTKTARMQVSWSFSFPCLIEDRRRI